MGDGRASEEPELMMPGSESQPEAAKRTPPSSNKSLRVGSWNVRTMYEAGKTAQVAREMQRYRLHILGISETRWIRHGQKLLSTGELLIYSGHEEADIHSEGVGMMLSKRAQKTLRGWEPHGSRIIVASFTTKKKLNLNVVQIYAPTNEAEDEEKDNFYTRLQDVINNLPEKDINILMGDANAKVGSDNAGHEEMMGKHGLGVENDNGERFKDLCGFNNMVIGGTLFPHRSIHKATWISPDGRTENQIDHVCISRKFRRSLEDVRAMRGADAATDHYLVIAKVKLKLRCYKPNVQGTRIKYQTSLLRDSQTKDDFKLTLTNRFQPLQDLQQEETNVNELWTRVKNTFTETCEEVLGLKKRSHQEWITQESINKIEERRTKKQALINSKTRAEKVAAQEAYRTAHKEVKQCIQQDKENYLNDLAEQTEAAAANGHMRIVFQNTHRLAGKFSKPETSVKDRNGKTIFGKEEQLNRWKEHFQSLLNRPPPDNPPEILPARNDLPIDCEPPTEEEISFALKFLKSGKAAGPDLIPPEALQADIPTTSRILQSLFEKIWNEEAFPDEWKEGHLIKLPKKGDLGNCNNYRGITLLSVPGKVFSRIILQRIKFQVDEKLRDQQAGFRKNRSCADQIATLRIILEQSMEWNSPLLVNFVDFEKAFDSVDRETLWKLMRHYGIPEKIVTLTRKMYEGSSCRVIHNGEMTVPFEVKTGVRQGCLLSPFLFILAIDWMMREVTAGRQNGIQWTLWTQLDDLDYADDVALLSHTQSQMQRKTNELNSTANRLGLSVNAEKTKVLKVKSDAETPINLNGSPLEEVDSFVYLGSIIDRKGGTEADIKRRIAQARFSFQQLSKVWKARKISLKTKLKLFNSNVKSVLFYGSETWTSTKTNFKKLQTFVNLCLRRILRIQWPERIRNEELWERTGQITVEEEIGRRRWRWIGHTLRKPNSSTTRHALRWNPQGQQSRGRARMTWRRCVKEDVKMSGFSWKQLQTLSQDRREWKSFVRGLYPEWGDGQ